MKIAHTAEYLDHLCTLPVSSIGRASDMLWIGFGDSIPCVNYRGEAVNRPEMALHVQAPWRIVSGSTVLLAQHDIYQPKDPIERDDSFCWDIGGNNRFDAKAGNWLADRIPLNPESWEIGPCFDLRITFANQDRLEIFSLTTDETECWRILYPSRDQAHLVCRGNQISKE